MHRSAPASASAGTTVTLSAIRPTYTAGYTYQWTAPAISSAPSGQSTNATMTAGGMNYSVTVCYADQPTRCSVVGERSRHGERSHKTRCLHNFTHQSGSGGGRFAHFICNVQHRLATIERYGRRTIASRYDQYIRLFYLTRLPVQFHNQQRRYTRSQYRIPLVTLTSRHRRQRPSETSTSVVNYCPVGQAYPNYEWFTSTAHNALNIRPQYGDNIYSIRFNIAPTQSTVGRTLSTLPTIISPSAGSPASIKDIRISQNPCDFTGTAQIIGIDGPTVGATSR